MIKEITEIWLKKLKKPANQGEYSYHAISGTNIILAKNYNDEFGLILTDTNEIPTNFLLKNFTFSYKIKLTTTSGVDYKRCQRMFASKDVKADYLIKILFGVLEDEQKPYSSNTLVRVLKELKDTFDPAEQKKIEVIGMWGELYLLHTLFDSRLSKIAIENILKSWEGDGGRKKIDFRFLHSKLAIEVKTTTEEQRIHHFSGLEQFTVPAGFKNLYFSSLRIIPEDGYTCYDLVNMINEKIKDKGLIELFDEKLLIRGKEISNDKYYRFTPRDEFKFSFYDAEKFETPSNPKGVSELKWKQDLATQKSVNSIKVKEIYKSIRMS